MRPGANSVATAAAGITLVLLLVAGPAHATPLAAAAPPQDGMPHGDLEISCTECHTTAAWVPVVQPVPFNHAAVGFGLDAGHSAAPCRACHESLVFQHVATACADCHTDPHAGEMGFMCETCHSAQGWQGHLESFVFHFTTGFPLVAPHASLGCSSCHDAAPPYESATTPTTCIGCHTTTFRNTRNPDHVAGGFPTDCEFCHTGTTWEAAAFTDHDRLFPLIGGHARVGCDACHVGGRFEGTPTECYACHEVDYRATTEPNHRDAGFSTACEECHDVSSWDRSSFGHTPGFPLTGAHHELDCVECHVDGYQSLPAGCFDCHADDYRSTTDPDHRASDFPTDCEVCHNQSRWDGATFDHEAVWRLTGAHRRLDCEACHATGYTGTPTDCYDCHAADYRQTIDPDHRASGFSTACDGCHTTRQWDGAKFDHNLVYPLNGAHRRLDCEACHTNGYNNTPTDCYDCHKADFRQATDPDHRSAGFPTDCSLCHSEQRWDDATFDHGLVYPLNGAHRRLDCEACHTNGYNNTPTDCYDCHAADYRQTTDPDHQSANFPTDCSLCHSEQKWDGATFDHDLVYPLNGAHQRLDCEACHANGYNNTPTDCYECHAADYRNTKDPDHVALNFPTDCTACHTEQKWDGATFDHDRLFPLIGAHRGVDCEACHTNGYNNTPSDCYGCHAADYQNTRDPNHSSLGFPTDCELCHSQTRWDGASFTDHDARYFPIYSGEHRGEWDRCTDCHVQPNSFGVFSCTDCHEHSQGNMAGEHDDVQGYQWVSSACYQCHPNGKED